MNSDKQYTPRSELVLVGHPFAPIGTGEHLRTSFRSFRSIGINVRIRDVYGYQEPDLDLQSELGQSLVRQSSDLVNIFYLNGDEVESSLRHLDADISKKSYNVIYPMWELSKYPEVWAEQLQRFDEIWAPSKFTQESIAAAVSKPVIHMPVAGEIRFESFLGRRYFKIPESSFVFLFFFDFTSYIGRKNPFAVLQAFDKMCKLRPDDDAYLVIKMKGGEMKRTDYEAFSDYTNRYKGRLGIIDGLLSDNEIKNLLRCCDCFVSLHRSEGFG
jgi:hypothetical protein